MQDVFVQVIVSVIAAVLTGGVSVALAFLQSRIKSERIGDALARLGGCAQAVVAELQQTTVDAWKEAGGKLTREQITELGKTAREKVLDLLDQPAAHLIAAAGADMDALICAKIEEAVYNLRNRPGGAVAG